MGAAGGVREKPRGHCGGVSGVGPGMREPGTTSLCDCVRGWTDARETVCDMSVCRLLHVRERNGVNDVECDGVPSPSVFMRDSGSGPSGEPVSGPGWDFDALRV